MRAGDSAVSLNQNLVEEEFRRVHNRHQRVLGELNLDVEEMLMPTAMPQPMLSPLPQQSQQHQQPIVNFIKTTPMLEPTDPMDFLGNGEVNDGVSNGAGNNVINSSSCNYNNINHNNNLNNLNNNMDLDSGFSGSNSSYIGSLRYQKSNAAAFINGTNNNTPSQLPVINHQHTDSGSSSFYGGSSSSAADEIGMISLCRSSSSLYESGKKSTSKQSPTAMMAATVQAAARGEIFGSVTMRPGFVEGKSAADSRGVSFWKAKSRGWISKLPGFSSTSSINNVGMGKYANFRLIE